MTVKCVVWDLDGTVWPGTAIESPRGDSATGPGPDLVPYPAALRAMTTLEERGIVNSVASRTAPEVAQAVADHPDLAGRFVAPQIGWDHKSEAVARIAGELGIDLSAVVLVDDSPFERAEVAAVLPAVRVLAPAELYAQLDTPLLRPAVVTAEAGARVERYRQEQQRRAAAAGFAGSREEFLRGCDIRLTVRPAAAEDLDRLAELADRTHRFNTTGEPWPADRLAAVLADPGWFAGVAHLADRFGEYGLVGLALCERQPDQLAARPGGQPAGSGWLLHLLAVSCRAAGRDVPPGLLRWVLARAAADGAGQLRVRVRPTSANLQLRVLLRGAGLTPEAGEPGGGALLLTRATSPLPPEVPWLRVVEPGPADRGALAGTAASSAALGSLGPAAPADPAVHPDPADVDQQVRALVAEAAGLDPARAARLSADTPLLAGGLGLSSLGGARLLAAVRARLGVDVAAEDLGLDCLETVGTLTGFVRHLVGPAVPNVPDLP